MTNQNAWFVTSFCTELTLFCTVKKKKEKEKNARLLTNQNVEISCFLLDWNRLEIESLSLLNFQRGGGRSRESSFYAGKAIPSYFAVQRRSNAPIFCQFEKKKSLHS